MVFSSVVFLFYFLPVVLFVALLLQRWVNGSAPGSLAVTVSNTWLLAASLAFYAWGDLGLLWVMLLSALLNYLGAWACVGGGRKARLALWFTIAANLALLGWFKYSGMFAEAANRLNALAGGLFGGGLSIGTVVLPLGISFYTFHGISYVVDVSRGKIAPCRSPLVFLCYYTLFPQLVAGPIVRYAEVGSFFRSRHVGLGDLGEGARRFIFGLGKKTLIANHAAVLVDTIFALPASDRSTPLAWLGMVAYTLQIYFDFSGYSDMAVGLGRMLGFVFPENFTHPLRSTSIREFWRRWHRTLSFFFRDYVYIPLGGSRGGLARTCANLFFVFALCGLWHGANWTFVMWGVIHGTVIVAERLTDRWAGTKARLGPLLGLPYTWTVVLFAFVLFRCDNWAQARDYFSALFGAAPDTGLQPLPWHAFGPEIQIALAAGLLLSLPILPALKRLVPSHPAATILGETAANAGLFVVFALCLLSIGSGSHNPFIYFRF